MAEALPTFNGFEFCVVGDNAIQRHDWLGKYSAQKVANIVSFIVFLCIIVGSDGRSIAAFQRI
jgi:hypothetical protein